MANYNYRSQFQYSYAGQAVVLRAKVSFGALGAPTIAVGTGMGIASITRSAAGDYVIALTNPFFALLGVRAIFNSGASAPAAPIIDVKLDSSALAAAPAVEIQCRDLTGAAADPASGEIMYLSLEFNRSSTGY